MTGDELDRAIQFLVESQAKLTSDIAQLTGRVNQVTSDVAQLTGNVNRLTGDVTQLTGGVNRLTGEATQARVELTDLKRVVAQFAANTALWAKESDGRMTRLETAMRELGGRMNELGGRLNELAGRTNERLQRLDAAMAEGAERMNALIRAVEGHITDETRHRPRPG